MPANAQERILPLLVALPADLDQIELDFDSSTQALSSYREFITDLRQALVSTKRISITLLPDWLDSPALPALLSAVDTSVLQLHGVFGHGRTLFDLPMAQRWVSQMLALRRPFYVALPNYGSRVSLNENGRLLAVENEMPQPGTGDHTHELFVPPITMANFLSWLKASTGGALQGIIWFRLPLDSDRRIWSRATWHAVMQHAPLAGDWRVEWQPGSARGSEGTLTLFNLSGIDYPAPAMISLHARCKLIHAGPYLLEIESDDTLVFARKEARLIRGNSDFAVGQLRCTDTPREFRVAD